MTDATRPHSSAEQAWALTVVRRRAGFRAHLVPYLLVVAALAVVNLVVTPHYPWVLWVAFGWGIGLGIHAAVVYGLRRPRDPRREQRQVDEILARRA